MSGRASRRLAAVATGLAIGLAIPVPARAGPGDPPAVSWSVPVAGPIALDTSAQGAVVSTNLGAVVAFDRRGREQWRAQLASNPAPHAVAGDSVVVGDDGALRVYARGDGVLRWSRAIDAPSARVAAGAGVALVSDVTGTVAAFDLADGAPAWRLHAGRVLYHEPVVDDARAAVLLVVPTDAGPVLRVLDARTGALRWEHPVDRFTAVPVVGGDRVLVAEGDGRFHAVVLSLDATTGVRHWASQVPASFESGIVPAVVGRTVLVVDHYGTVSALDRDTGRLRWERRLGQTVLATRIVPAGHHAVLTTAAMEVVVLAHANGRVVRRLSARALGGWAVDVRPARFRRSGGVVAALRLGGRERVELWPTP